MVQGMQDFENFDFKEIMAMKERLSGFQVSHTPLIIVTNSKSVDSFNSSKQSTMETWHYSLTWAAWKQI